MTRCQAAELLWKQALTSDYAAKQVTKTTWLDGAMYLIRNGSGPEQMAAIGLLKAMLQRKSTARVWKELQAQYDKQLMVGLHRIMSSIDGHERSKACFSVSLLVHVCCRLGTSCQCEADVQKHAFARTSPVRPSRPWHARRCTVHLSIVSSTAAGHGFVQLTFSERRVAWSEDAVQRQT